MQYAQARYYIPNTGRFTAEDPIKDQLNWYGYCNANPATLVDPSGLEMHEFDPQQALSQRPYWSQLPSQNAQPQLQIPLPSPISPVNNGTSGSTRSSNPTTVSTAGQTNSSNPTTVSTVRDPSSIGSNANHQPLPLGQRVDGFNGFYSYGFKHGGSMPNLSWNHSDGFGVAGGIYGTVGVLGRESTGLVLPNDTSISLLTGGAQAGLVFKPDVENGDNFLGFEFGFRLIQSETEFEIRLPFVNKNLLVGAEAHFGAMGSRLTLNDGKLSFGKALVAGYALTLGLERAGDCD